MTTQFTLSPLWAILPNQSERVFQMHNRQLTFYSKPPEEMDKRFKCDINLLDMSISPATFEIKEGVGVLPIQGMIIPKSDFFSIFFGGFAALDILERDFLELAGREDVHTIVLDIDSPGGNAFGVQQFANIIYEARNKKPVIAVRHGKGRPRFGPTVEYMCVLEEHQDQQQHVAGLESAPAGQQAPLEKGKAGAADKQAGEHRLLDHLAVKNAFPWRTGRTARLDTCFGFMISARREAPRPSPPAYRRPRQPPRSPWRPRAPARRSGATAAVPRARRIGPPSRRKSAATRGPDSFRRCRQSRTVHVAAVQAP